MFVLRCQATIGWFKALGRENMKITTLALMVDAPRCLAVGGVMRANRGTGSSTPAVTPCRGESAPRLGAANRLPLLPMVRAIMPSTTSPRALLPDAQPPAGSDAQPERGTYGRHRADCQLGGRAWARTPPPRRCRGLRTTIRGLPSRQRPNPKTRRLRDARGCQDRRADPRSPRREGTMTTITVMVTATTIDCPMDGLFQARA